MASFIYENLAVDFDSRLITSNGNELTLDAKAFNTLAVLVDNKDRVVSTIELIESVWGNRPVNNDVVTASVGRIRRVFRDAGIEAEVVRTAHKVGYQFVLELDSESTTDTSVNTHDEVDRDLRVKRLQRVNLALAALLVAAALALAHHYSKKSTNNANSDQHLPLTKNTTFVAEVERKKPTEIFIIRHAEKEPDGTDDPPLSKLGIARAKRWGELLAEVEFDEILTTRFVRNTQTVEYIFGKDLDNLKYYSALSFDIAAQLQGFSGKKIAIIAHSNTIPSMVNRLVKDRQYAAKDHRNYELIYHITVDSSGGVSSNQLRLNYDPLE